jgi:uncharacterized protein
MNLYLDASALVKRYIAELASDQVNEWIIHAELVVTGLITRVEVAAAIARAGRMNIINREEALSALRSFRSEWESFQRLPITHTTVMRGDLLAWEHNLRGYDAVHLACALLWGENLGSPVTLGTFDRQMRQAALDIGIEVLPAGFDRT